VRVPQEKSNRGSQKWLQTVINNTPHLLDEKLRSEFRLAPVCCIEWLSPLDADGFAEYRDEAFVQRLGVSNARVPLKQFWPERGPQWDGLGRLSPSGPYFLVEAKANIPELVSSCQAGNPCSQELIRRSLEDTQGFLRSKSLVPWEKGFYQYANRIAHLYYMRVLNRLKAYLVFVYFLNDAAHEPTTRAEWGGALTLQKRLMGLSRHRLQRYIAEVFLDVKEIETAAGAGQAPCSY
jgi:hypothetical protein